MTLTFKHEVVSEELLAVNFVQSILEVKVARGDLRSGRNLTCCSQVLCVALIVPDKLCIGLTGMVDPGQVGEHPALKTVGVPDSPNLNGYNILSKKCLRIKVILSRKY